MFRTPKRLWTLLLLVPLLAGVITAQEYEEEENDEPGARVARVSYLDGESKIKRIDTEEWEEVVDNLPIVEGDIIETGKNTKLEIQLDRFSFLMLDEDSVLRFTFLADDGIALSLSKGTLGVSLIRFEKKDTYLEIDAPKTTVAIQKNGLYRIDAGDEYNKEVRVSVRDDGEARVYSEDSGFLLGDGRSARLFLDGTFEGEWETSRNSTLSDNFDYWLKDRNQAIAAAFDDDDDRDFYDDDVYGADDLDRYGDWVYIADYGNVWRPSSRAIATYLNWSPYRYGSWRWLPYYGWTWVNDEPWGWATYHYGRWVFHRGRWYWSPHRQFHRGRSWWRPALVFVTYIGNNFCWYPLPYGYRYYNYNRRFGHRWNRKRRNNRGPKPVRTPPVNPPKNPTFGGRKLPGEIKPPGNVPSTGVIAVQAGQFGSRQKGFGIAPLNVARQVLAKRPTIDNSPPVVPDRKFEQKVGVQTADTMQFDRKTGAAPRKSVEPLDDSLREQKIYGNRTPAPARPADNSDTQKPRTGAFDRTRNTKVDSKATGTGPVYSPPIRRETPKPRVNDTEQKQTPPLVRPRPRPGPKSTPETKQPERKQSPPIRRTSPPVRPSPPVKRSPPPSRPAPKPSAPKRAEPKRSPPKPKPAETKPSSPKKPKPGELD